jgi:F-type H+-transporting ATPase subunit b
MELLMPKLGLFLWTVILFVILFLILAKFAWKPIVKALKAREESIANALAEAAKARDEMQRLTADNERLMAQARADRDQMMKEARAMKDQIIAEAKAEAAEVSGRMMDKAREEITAEKMRALTEIKNQVGKLSIEVAEKVLRKQLSNSNELSSFVDEQVKTLKLN